MGSGVFFVFFFRFLGFCCFLASMMTGAATGVAACRTATPCGARTCHAEAQQASSATIDVASRERMPPLVASTQAASEKGDLAALE